MGVQGYFPYSICGLDHFTSEPFNYYALSVTLILLE